MSEAVNAAERAYVQLGGRFFCVIDFDQRSVLQDHYLLRITRELGLDKMLPDPEETDVAYQVRMHNALVDSGRAHELLAGYLLPKGVDERAWTPAIAVEVAAHIGACTARKDRDLVLALGMQVVFGFFRQGLEQLERFRASLAPSPQDPTQDRPPGAPLH
jgi:hypothetical protein